MDSHEIFNCLHHYVIWFKKDATFHCWNLKHIRTDAGTYFTSEDFIADCEEHGIKLTFAAPRHQEMNGICERAWGIIRAMAFSFLVHARVGFEFFSLALEHAWKVHACLPV